MCHGTSQDVEPYLCMLFQSYTESALKFRQPINKVRNSVEQLCIQNVDRIIKLSVSKFRLNPELTAPNFYY